MFPSYAYDGQPTRQRRFSQAPSFFDFTHRSPYSPCYSLQSEPSLSQPSFQQPYDPNLVSPYSRRFSQLPDYGDAYQELQSRRARQLREQQRNQQIERQTRAQHERETARLRNHPAQYHQDAIRSERARRLAEAQQRKRMAETPEPDVQVEIDLPDGRTCVVPLSWARKMQARYPNHLTEDMIRPISRRPPQPEPEPDEVLMSDGSSDHDSDFYALAPEQNPKVDVLIPNSSKKRPPNKHTQEEMDAAARLIQHQFRQHRRLRLLKQLESKLAHLRADFSYPDPLQLSFISPSNSGIDSQTTAPNTKLAFNHPINRPVQAFEESLLQLQIQLDGITSGGDENIKAQRKQLIKEVEIELEKLDRFKLDAWNAQHASHSAANSPVREQISPPVEAHREDQQDDSAMDNIDHNTVGTANVTPEIAV